MAKRELRGLRAIITGTSSGLGRALALELGRHGVQLVLTSRRQDRLETLCDEIRSGGGSAISIAGDITDGPFRRSLIDSCLSEFGGLDILVNNAGVGGIGPFQIADANRLRTIFEVNLFAPLELTRMALPELARGRTPIVVNIGSVLGHVAVPNKSEYCASKSALRGFSNALRAELAPCGIDVLLVSPSTIDSEFFEHVLLSPDSSASAVTQSSQVPADGRARGRHVRKRRGMAPEYLARSTARAMMQKRREIILPLEGRLVVWFHRMFPETCQRVIRRLAR